MFPNRAFIILANHNIIILFNFKGYFIYLILFQKL